MPENNSYVYRHITKDTNQVFYIGIGSDLNFYRASEKSNRNNTWKEISNRSGYDIEIMLYDLDYEYAKEKEKEFIKLYGRLDSGTGTLCNRTAGGQGVLGLIPTKENIEKLRIRSIGNTYHKGHKHSQEVRRKISYVVRQSNINNPDLRIKLGEKRKGTMLGKESTFYKYDVVAFKDGVEIGIFEGIHDASRKLNLDYRNIHLVISGKRKHHKKYIFCKIENGELSSELKQKAIEDSKIYSNPNYIKPSRPKKEILEFAIDENGEFKKVIPKAFNGFISDWHKQCRILYTQNYNREYKKKTK